MQELSSSGVRQLAQRRRRPVISLYLPTEKAGPETRQSPIRFKNAVSEAKKQTRGLPNGERLRERLEADCEPKIGDDDFWQNRSEGLAVFCDDDGCEWRSLAAPPPQVVSVGRRFYITPLLPLTAQDEDFLLLALSGKRCELFRGDAGALEKVEIEALPQSLEHALRFDDPEKSLQFHTGAPGSAASFHGQGSSGDDRKDRFLRYFQAVDHALSPFLEQERLPLLLATVDDHVPLYRRANSYSGLVDEQWVGGAPDEATSDQLHGRAMRIVREWRHRTEREAVERLHSLMGTDNATADIRKIAAAIAQGRVQTTYVAADRTQAGSLDPDTGEVDLAGDGETDVLNELAAETLLRGGEAHAVPAAALPEGASAGAIFRF